MRGQDIVIWVLYYLAGLSKRPQVSEYQVCSQAEEYNALRRLKERGLIKSESIKMVNEQRFLHFLEEGIQYVFPAEMKKGLQSKGIKTVTPALEENSLIGPPLMLVWPSPDGHDQGIPIKPVHKSCLTLACRNKRAYQFLCLIDAVRIVGEPRLREVAIERISEIFNQRNHTFL